MLLRLATKEGAGGPNPPQHPPDRPPPPDPARRLHSPPPHALGDRRRHVPEPAPDPRARPRGGRLADRRPPEHARPAASVGGHGPLTPDREAAAPPPPPPRPPPRGRRGPSEPPLPRVGRPARAAARHCRLVRAPLRPQLRPGQGGAAPPRLPRGHQ